MRHASLFSGIGGFDLAAQWMGWENVFQVEKDAFCQKVLEKNFPHTKRYGDIEEFDGTPYRNSVDILTGGFPCQPYSSAGKQRGLDDERHLWPEMRRVIREIAPTYVVGENVLGLVSWSKGLVFEQVHTDLEADGYEVQAFILPAAGVGAPHQRYRVWFVAHSTNHRCESQDRSNNWNKGGILSKGIETRGKFGGCGKTITNADKELIQRQLIKSGEREPNRRDWSSWPLAEPEICRGDDGISGRLDRIKALGNAIVPQVAFQIFKAIQEIA